MTKAKAILGTYENDVFVQTNPTDSHVVHKYMAHRIEEVGAIYEAKGYQVVYAD
jgi:hypothetical protein